MHSALNMRAYSAPNDSRDPTQIHQLIKDGEKHFALLDAFKNEYKVNICVCKLVCG